MAKQPRYFLFLTLLTFSAVLIAPLVQAQENNETPYLPITLDNLTQLQALFTFPCAKENYSVSGVAFTGNTFLYECYTGKAAFAVRSLPENRHLWGYITTGWARELTLLDGGDLILADFQRNLSLIRRGDGAESAKVDFIIHAPVAVSPDRKRVALVQGELESRLNTVVIYSLPDLTPLEVTFPIAGQPQQAKLALTDAEQGLIAIGESEGTVRVLEVESGEVVMETSMLNTELDYTNYIDATFTPDASHLLVSICTLDQMGCFEIGILDFDVASGELVKASAIPQFAYIDFLDFSPATSLLMFTSCKQAHFLDVETFEIFDTNIDVGNRCGGMNSAMNEDGTLIAMFDQPQNAFVVYGIPRDSS